MTTSSVPKNTRVGTAAVITDGRGHVVVGKRKGSHGSGTWQLPGGHLDWMEDHHKCAEREAKEETDLDVTAVKTLTITNDVFKKEDKHYITIFVLCSMNNENAQPKVMEPNKCDGWYWKSWDDLRKLNEDPEEHLFQPMINLLAQTLDLEALSKV